MIVGLCGYARVGKDTIGAALENYQRFAFADVLKAQVQKMLQVGGIDANLYEVEDKERWRDMLVFWGAKRRSLDPDYWIKQLSIRLAGKFDERIVITDVRYPNEVKWILSHGGVVIRVSRPGFAAANAEEKSSITAIDCLYDLPVICNDGTAQQAAAAVRKIIKQASGAGL